LTDTKALFVELFSTMFPGVTKALVDSGSSDSFIDPNFVVHHKLSTRSIDPLLLSLIDGTVSNFVKEIVTVPIKLICSSFFELDLFVTPLAGEHPIVLGYSWLKTTNPSINWAKNMLELPQDQETKQNIMPPIVLVGTAAFKRACQEQGSLLFQLAPSSSNTRHGKASILLRGTTELNNVPEDYQEFSDVFSKNKSKQLSPYRDHDLSIQIEEGTQPSLGPIYSLSALELTTLHEFIEDNLKLGLI